MSKMIIVLCGIWAIAAIPQAALGNPGDWVNSVGPYFMPHVYVGNPAIGSDATGTYLLGPACRAFHPDHKGIFRSLDIGANWQLVDQECPAIEAVTFEQHPRYAWTCGDGPDHYLKKSMDYGRTWTDAMDGIDPIEGLRATCIDLLQASYNEGAENAILYTGIARPQSYLDGHLIYKSTDGGETWSDLGLWGGYRTGTLDVDIFQDDVGDHVAVVTDETGIYFRNRIYISTDGGGSWQVHGSLLPEPNCISYAPFSNDVLYAGSTIPAESYYAVIYRKVGNGGWAVIPSHDFVRSDVDRLLVLNDGADIENDTILAATGLGIYVGINDEGNWNWDLWNRDDGLCDDRVTGMEVDPDDHGTIAASTWSRFYVTTDFGATWLERCQDISLHHLSTLFLRLKFMTRLPWTAGAMVGARQRPHITLR